MSKKKTALQRLAFKIAEDIDERFMVREPLSDAFTTTEEIYRFVYAVLPFDQEDWAAEQERFDASMEKSEIIRQAQKPTALQLLREAVHADKGTPLNVVLDAAITKLKNIDNEIKKEMSLRDRDTSGHE